MSSIAMFAECDYVKLSAKVEHDILQDVLMPHLTRAEMRTLNTFAMQPRQKFTSLGEWGDGKRLYIIEYPGQSGYIWYALNYHEVRRHVSRLDAKKKISITDEGLQIFYQMCKRGKKGGRNIGEQEGKLRAKTDKRDAGGKGFFIGSHKSAYRIHVTKRGHETGYIEFMYKDERLEKELKVMDSSVFAHPSSPADQAAVIDHLFEQGMQDLCKIVAMNKTDIYKILGGGLDTGMSQLEKDMTSIELQMKAMPREAVAALVATAIDYKQLSMEDIGLSR